VFTDFGCEHSFARASQSVFEHYGFELGASSIRRATLKHAQRAQSKLQEIYAKPFRVLPAAGQENVIAETDGTMVCTVKSGPRKNKRPREWKEMRLVAAQAKESTTTFYGATFGSVQDTAVRWGHSARDAVFPSVCEVARLTRSSFGLTAPDRLFCRSSPLYLAMWLNLYILFCNYLHHPHPL